MYQQLSVTKNELNILIGRFPADWQPPEFELTRFVLPSELPLSIPSELIHNRTDILASEALLHSASANIGIATANLYPQLSLSANTSQQALNLHNLFDASSNAWGLLGGITSPIFNGGTLSAQRRAAIHAYNAAYANYREVIVQAFVQVSNVLSALKNDEMEVVQERKALSTAEESLKLSRLSYEAGNTGLLDILYSERLYTQAILGYQKAVAQR